MTPADLAEEYRRRSLAPNGGAYAIAAGLLTVAEEQGRIATWLKYLGTGDAAGTMGAVESLGVCVKEGLSEVSSARSEAAERLANAIDGIP